MLRLRKLLLCNYVYYGLFIIVVLLTIIRINVRKESYYSLSNYEVVGVIIAIKEKDGKTTYQIKAKELLIATVNQNNKYELGDKVRIKGEFQEPFSSNDKNLWNYQEYLKHKGIFYVIRIYSINLIKHNRNIYYKIKQFVYNSFNNNPYLYTFIMGDKNLLSSEVIRSYQENGISHLFAISGMHISLLAMILEKLFRKKIDEERCYHVISVFLIGYLLLVGFSPSILRGVGFYIVFLGNDIYYFYIKKENLFLFVLSISLLVNPFYIYDVGFQYSYLISYSLLKMSSNLNSSSKLLSLIKVSLLSFMVSIPITIKNYNQINIFSILYNVFYVPYVSTVVFPLSLVTFIIKPILPIYSLSTSILEKTSLFLSHVRIGILVWKQMPSITYYIYFVLIILYLNIQRRWIIWLFVVFLLIHYFIPFVDNTNYVKALDVGQGDSTLIRINKNNILIDTGGQRNNNLYYNTLNPLFKKQGMNTIDYLVITHGDYDHMGEAINIVENFKVEKVIFNCGEFNDLEQELIKVLDKKKIPYYSCIKELNIDSNKLYFLQTKEYDNENDNSNVIYTELNGYKFMFMGDAGVEKEKDILDEYNLSDIDVLKVGHHGSKTSSNESFINEINPKYSVISVGKNNRYGHPNKEVLDNLKDTKIYRTDIDGSIMFKIKNNKLKIETCTP